VEQQNAKQYDSNKRPARWKIKDLCYDSVYHLNEQSDTAQLMRNYMNIERKVETDYGAFKNYIQNAYDTADKKESVCARFKRVDKNKEYFLNNKWFSFTVTTKIINGKYESDQTKIDTLKEYGMTVNDIRVDSVWINNSEIKVIKESNKFFFKFEQTDFQILINKDSNIKIVLNQWVSSSVDYDGKTINVINNKVWIEEFKDNQCEDSTHAFITYSLNKADNNQAKNRVTLELEDDDKSELSVYDVFFNEDVESIYLEGNKKQTFDVKDKVKEYGHLVIQTDKPELFKNEGKIYVSTNRYQLRCQKNAIDILVNRPSEFHRPLLLLSDDIEKSYLDSFKSYKLIDNQAFKVLTKDSLKGNSIQREFVSKALSTPDMMILEGPPGSGKTTAILEFIYQVLKEGKKILLCASTHVAIDNVLEKIIKHPDNENILKYINPIRIGDENNVYVPEVQKYCYENVMRGVEEKYRLIVEDSFNLVCGTTIGILRYPKFKEALDRDNDAQSIEPMFDYMIIDEASKTTFNEFLVPAIFAKKWVIVGDVKQLAPYVERNDLTPTLITSKPLNSKENRRAIYFLTMLENQKDQMKNYVFIMSNSSIRYIDSFIDDKDKEGLIAITNKKLNNIFSITQDEIEHKSFELAALSSNNHIIIAEESLLKTSLNYLSTNYKVIGDNNNMTSINYFEDYKILHHRIDNYSKQKAVYDLFDSYSKNLEDEIIWRLIRMYELTNNDPKKKIAYEKYINNITKYLPLEMKKDYEETIAMLEEISLPSIIMLLQNGIKKRSTNPKKTILNSGLTEENKQNRFLTLEYQYRMHGDISRIPRKFIYDDRALKDDTRTYASFQYINNKPRFEIRNVVCENIERNKNEEEANAIVQELDLYFKNSPNKGTKIAILTFYNGQVYYLRQLLQKYFSSNSKYSFKKNGIEVSLNTVDKFQGQEADIVYLSMVQNYRVGFLDSVNRMNVAITRAKDKLIIFGNKKFFQDQNYSELLKNIFKEVN